MSDVQCIEFQKEYPVVNLKMKNDDEKKYEFSLLVLYTLETERGFMVKKIGKITRKGTKVNFIPFKSDEDVKNYRDFLLEKSKAFTEKWGTKVKLVQGEMKRGASDGF